MRAGIFQPGEYAIDGDEATYWLSQTIGDPVRDIGFEFFALPHDMDLVMGGQVNTVAGVVYLPRQGARRLFFFCDALA